MARRPVIVVTNDDGIHAAGLSALADAMSLLGEAYVIAPETEQSATSHSITLTRPLRLREVAPRRYALDGTPVDCVYVAMHHGTLLPRRPSVVVSGINHGLNLGSDVFYSGTVAGAREGALRGIASIAFSLAADGDREAAARAATRMVARLLAWRAEHPDETAPLLNVNFPRGKPRGVRATVTGTRTYEDVVEVRNDPRGRQYLWIGGPNITHHGQAPGTDTHAYDHGYTSVTPLRLDLVHPERMVLAERVASGARTPRGR